MDAWPGEPSNLPIGRSPLVGRAAPWALLTSLVAEMCAGRPPAAVVVLLSGAPGIGKTRLLEELPPPELEEGMTVLRSGASQAEGMPPYLPFLESLGAYIAAAPLDRLHEQIGSRAGSLATLLPEIVTHFGPPPPAPVLGPEQDRFRLYEAVAGFLAAIAAQTPLLLLLDDLQWADAATFDLLVHVASHSRPSPLLIVGAYREGEAEENRALVRARAELNRRRLLLTLPIHPLAQEESAALVVHLLAGPVAPELAARLHRQSEGNPFFLEELVRTLLDEAMLVRQEQGWTLMGEPGNLLPPRAAEAIHMRLARLDPAVVELLRVAAVVGRISDSTLLAHVLETDVEQVEEQLRVAARASLVRPEAEGSYAFTHDLVRETLYADVGPARRSRLHRRIGAVLEAQDADTARAPTPQRLADLAFHFAAAGLSSRALPYALASGAQALAASAAVEAMAHFHRALRLLGADEDAPARATALVGVGDAATLAGNYTQAADAYTAAQALWLELGESAAAAHAWLGLGKVRWRQEAVAEARTAFEEALTLLGPQDSPDAAEALLQLGDLYATTLHQQAQGLAYVEQALAMVEAAAGAAWTRRLEARAYCVLGNTQARMNDLAAGRSFLARAHSLAVAMDDPALVAEVCAYLANVCNWAGELQQACGFLRQRATYARRTQDPFHLRDVYSALAFTHLLQGQWAEAEEHFTRQEQLLADFEGPEPHAALHNYRGLMHYFQGRFAAADQAYRTAAELLRPTGSPTLVWYLGWWGETLAELGRREEALACFAELHTLADTLDVRARARGNAYAQVAVGYARIGEWPRAAACYPSLLAFQGQVSPVLINRGLGVAAWAAQDRAAAQRHLADAAAQARAAGMRPELALTLLQWARIVRELPAAARLAHPDDLLAEGLRLAGELGMQELGRRFLHLEAPQPGRPRRVAGLSARELEVLRLVAQGKTNREIAQSLVLSEKTVARHLTHIFTKTGVANRAGAATFALRHGLA